MAVVNLIKLTLLSGNGPVYVNPAHVTYVRRREESPYGEWTEIHFHGNDWTGVTESLEKVAGMILRGDE